MVEETGGGGGSRKGPHLLSCFSFGEKEAFISDFIYHVRGGFLPISKNPNNPLTSYAKYNSAFALGE